MKLTRKNLRRIILQEMRNDWSSHNKRNQQFASAQRSYDSMTPPDDGGEPPSADSTDEEIFIRSLKDIRRTSALDEGVYLTLDEATGTVTDSSGNIVARYVDTGEMVGQWPKQNFEVIDEQSLIAALKAHFIQFDLAEQYADNYDDVIISQSSNNY